ncbi:MAG TPA: aminotransferase class I/II-fold pyridoxal phosphate-dependent enzyme [Deltaproteobacteria bacterium]|nr:aminotransferase class I/II-fold pyridoxal phosphate-dependent enzyme [Deltaproteobacteria bacterium]
MNPIAQALCEKLEEAAPEVLAMLSAYGRRLYFPKGIISQTAEARQKADRFNATIGIATEKGRPMALPSIAAHLGDVPVADAVNYAPPAGRPDLRARWREKLQAENPSLTGKSFGQPIVTAAITHGLNLAGELFVDPGDVILMPDKLWGNYRLTYEVHHGAKIETFPFYASGSGGSTAVDASGPESGGLDTASFAERLGELARDHAKIIVLLNFPNNPTGYMPTPAEGDALASALERQAERGTRIVVFCDDAYFGLFYHLGGPSMTESLFGKLTGRHPNLLAVKLDGATKELFVWGLRCGFITFGPGRPESAEVVCEVLDAKVRGAIRGGVSNVPQLSQSLVQRALESPSLADERKEKCETLRARAQRVFEVANDPRYAESWSVYPFNSGYFMLVKVKGVDAEKLRVHLLEEHGVGLIATSSTDIRVAFSCLEVEEVDPLFEALHRAIGELRPSDA